MRSIGSSEAGRERDVKTAAVSSAPVVGVYRPSADFRSPAREACSQVKSGSSRPK